jgi:hypothetical protein
MKAQYDGLFASGKFDLSGITKEQWSSYQSDSHITIQGVGGDPKLLIKLSHQEPFTPSQGSVDLASAWSETLSVSPGIVDFGLAGVWELIRDPARAAAVQEAWQLYSDIMHPRVTLQSWSTELPWPCQIPPRPPIVITDKIVKPDNPIQSPVGAQVVILAGQGSVGPAVRFDKYYSLPLEYRWPGTYRAMWDQIASDLDSRAKKGDILLVVTFGQFLNMPPTDSSVAMFERAGASTTLMYWLTHCNPGSQYGNPSVWTNQPRIYALAGVFGQDRGTAVEAFVGDNYSVNLDLTVYLYRQAFTGQYTIAVG